MLLRRIQRPSFPGKRWAFGPPPNTLSQGHNSGDLEASVWGIPLSAGSSRDVHLGLMEMIAWKCHTLPGKVVSGKDVCGVCRERAALQDIALDWALQGMVSLGRRANCLLLRTMSLGRGSQVSKALGFTERSVPPCGWRQCVGTILRTGPSSGSFSD